MSVGGNTWDKPGVKCNGKKEISVGSVKYFLSKKKNPNEFISQCRVSKTQHTILINYSIRYYSKSSTFYFLIYLHQCDNFC